MIFCSECSSHPLLSRFGSCIKWRSCFHWRLRKYVWEISLWSFVNVGQCSPLTFGSFIPFELYCGTPISLPYEKLGNFVQEIYRLPCFLVSCILFMVIYHSDASTWRYKWFLFCCLLQIAEFSVWKIRLICSPLSWLDITLIQTNGSRLRIFFCLFSKVCENSYGRNLFDFVSWCSCHRHPFDSYKWRHINEFLVRKQKPKHKHIVEPNVATEYDLLEVPTYVSPPVYSLP